MKTEELLQLLQEKGLDDDAIKTLLQDTLGALEKDFVEHDESKEKEEAEKLLGVQL